MAKQGLLQVTPPAAEPIDLGAALEHCRATPGVDDAFVARAVRAARRYVEAVTGRQLVTATWRLSLDSFYGQALEPRPGVSGFNLAGALNATADAWRAWQERGGGWVAGEVGTIRLPRPPLAGSVVAGVWTPAALTVQYADTAGVWQTAAASVWQVDGDREPARLAPAYGQVWPATRARLAAVQVTYQAGYGPPASVPEQLVEAILLLVGHWFANREALLVGAVTGEMALGVAGLLGLEWTGEFC